MAEGHRPLHGVLQLAYVAGKGIAPELLQRRGGQAPHRATVTCGEMRDEAGGEQFAVFLAIAKRRHLQDEGLQAKKQVFTKGLPAGGGFQRPVAGSDDAHIHVQFALATHRPDGALL